MIFTKILNQPHLIHKCSLKDVDPHYELIKHWITDTEEEVFKGRMIECVEQGNAIMTEDRKAFLYYYVVSRGIAEGRALYGKGAPLKLLSLFIGHFSTTDRSTFKIDFKLHDGKFLQEYKSFLTTTSIKRSVIPGHPLVVRVDQLRKKFDAIARKREEKWVVS